MNRNFYEMARKRCMSKPPFGTKIITDADIILMQEEEIEHYRKTVASFEAAIANKKLEILAIKDELSSMADKKKAIKDELGRVADKNKQLTEENKKLAMRLEDAVDSFSSKLNEAMGLERELSAMNARITGLEIENKKLKKEIDTLEGKLAYCENELAEKKAECMELDSDNVKLQQEIDSYKESIKLRVGDFIRFGEIKYKIVKATVKPDGIVTAVAFECLEQAE